VICILGAVVVHWNASGSRFKGAVMGSKCFYG